MAAIDAKLMARLNQIADRQEAMIRAIDAQTECIATVGAMVQELLEWAHRPPSSALEEALRNIAGALSAIDNRLAGLPEQVADAVAARFR